MLPWVLEPGEQPREPHAWTSQLPGKQACAQEKAGRPLTVPEHLPPVGSSLLGPVSENDDTDAQPGVRAYPGVPELVEEEPSSDSRLTALPRLTFLAHHLSSALTEFACASPGSTDLHS